MAVEGGRPTRATGHSWPASVPRAGLDPAAVVAAGAALADEVGVAELTMGRLAERREMLDARSIELQCSPDRLEHVGRGVDPPALLEPRVTRDRHAGEQRHLLPPQAGRAATAASGEGDLFRKVIGWSIVLLLLMCILVYLQSTAVLGWMIPS